MPQEITLLIYAHDAYGDYVAGRHVVRQGWDAAQAVDLIRKDWGGIWVGEDSNTFLPWHSISKIEQVQENTDGESKAGIHGNG